MEKKQLVVVAAIIDDGLGKYLITQRQAGKHLAGKWEFPGGVVEFGEDPDKRLKIELKQELGIEAHVFNRILGYSSYVYEGGMHVILLAFYCVIWGSRLIQKIGIQDYKWVTPKEMAKYDFCEADQVFVKKLQKGDLRSGGAYFQ